MYTTKVGWVEGHVGLAQGMERALEAYPRLGFSHCCHQYLQVRPSNPPREARHLYSRPLVSIGDCSRSPQMDGKVH